MVQLINLRLDLLHKELNKKLILIFWYFSPITRVTSIRLLIIVAIIYNLGIHQVDIKTAFSNGDLDGKNFMDQLEGFVQPEQESKVCKLNKFLYDLKQAPKQWYENFDSCMIRNGFKNNECDNCI